jgi:hypothetical protein
LLDLVDNFCGMNGIRERIDGVAPPSLDAVDELRQFALKQVDHGEIVEVAAFVVKAATLPAVNDGGHEVQQAGRHGSVGTRDLEIVPVRRGNEIPS